ncbi:MAG: TRAP transporter TatT component family protein [Acidobacteriota bacterium]|nr:TRAP transporter TatT component family protein [Acidobacteriota bacterium]
MNKTMKTGIAAFVALLLTASCSVEKLALKKVAGMMTSPGSGGVFTQDNDPELVGDALPFAIKLYETLLTSLPDHEGLRLVTGSLYITYANAFIQTPADMTPKRDLETREFLFRRAKNLYLRGRDILLVHLEKKNPALLDQLKNRRYRDALAVFGRQDAGFLYWTALGWVGAFGSDPFDMKFGLTLPQAASLMERVHQVDPGYDPAAVELFYIYYYGSLPEYMGGDLQKAREHFERAKTVSGETNTSHLVALAVTVCVKEQNAAEFRDLLSQVLKFDADRLPDNRLVNVLNRRKAKWLLDNIDDYFIELDGNSDPAGQEDIQ